MIADEVPVVRYIGMRLTLGLFALLLGPCARDGDADQPRPTQLPADAGARLPKGAPVTGNDPAKNALGLIQAVASLSEFKADVERIFEVELQRRPPEHLKHFEARSASGPFGRTDLREAVPGIAASSIVVLEARPEAPLSLSEFEAKGALDAAAPSDVDSRIPPEGVLVFVLSERPGQRVLAQFLAKRRTLRPVAFHRDPVK